jgi:hypothetical protein
MVVAAFAHGVASQLVHAGHGISDFDRITALVLVSLIYLWIRTDAQEVGYRVSPLLSIGVIGVALLAVPYYFVLSRGARSGIVRSLLGLAFVGVLLLVSWGGSWAAYFATGA